MFDQFQAPGHFGRAVRVGVGCGLLDIAVVVVRDSECVGVGALLLGYSLELFDSPTIWAAAQSAAAKKTGRVGAGVTEMSENEGLDVG